MINGLIGQKIGMTQIFNEKGEVVPVTVIKAGPCIVTTVKNKDIDGYNAVQVGFLEVNPEKVSKPYKEYFSKKGLPVFKYLSEFKLIDNKSELKQGEKFTIDLFKVGEKVKIIGYSKGKGFTGVIKRWGFHGAPASHGTSKVHRKPMSAGATDGARVFKGKKSPGRMGNEKRTALNLMVIETVKDENLLVVKGSVPGPTKGILKIYKK